MKIGVVGPSNSIKQVEELVNSDFKYIELIKLGYEDYREVASIIKKYQRNLDALLFTGTTPFLFASKQNLPYIPWEYIPRHGSSLLSVLLKISTLRKYDLYNISFDSYSYEQLYEVYYESGIGAESINLYVANEKIHDQDYIDYLYDFHKENYMNEKASCCVTGIDSVYSKLSSDGIPCFKIKHTSNVIRETLTKLKLKYLAYNNHNNQMLVLAVEIDAPNEESIISRNEYQIAFENMKVSEQIYLFAQRIEAAVVEINSGNYLLFSTTSIFENETDNLRNIDLLNMISKNTKSTVSIGIGYGRTANESKYGATLGKKRAKKCGGNRVFVVYEGEKIAGPINNIKSVEVDDVIIDEKLLEIAEKTGLGKNTIFKLNSIIMQYKIDSITPKELARLYGVTPRSMNRIIVALEQCGYVKTVGKKFITDAGRPSRVIKIKFDYIDLI